MALTTKHQVLAWDLVEGLDDEKHKGIYFWLAKTYDETFLRSILSLAKDSMRRGQIKREDAGRYFMGILKKELTKINSYVKNNGKNIKNNSRRRPDIKRKSRNRK